LPIDLEQFLPYLNRFFDFTGLIQALCLLAKPVRLHRELISPLLSQISFGRRSVRRRPYEGALNDLLMDEIL